jgi:hypothetical protein|nr:MAG TPA: hypothetical protein [Caudoviricetes sp.]
METHNHDEKLRRSWTEHTLRGIEKITPMVTLHIEDEQLAVSIEAQIEDHHIHIDLMPTERSAWLTIGDINYISLETPEKTYMHWPNISDSWTDTTRWLVDTVKPLVIAKKAVQQLMSKKFLTRYTEVLTCEHIMDYLDRVWDSQKMVVEDDKIEFEAERGEKFIQITYEYAPEGPTISIEYEDQASDDELKVQLTPGVQLHQWLYEQIVSYTVRHDLYYRYRLAIL